MWDCEDQEKNQSMWKKQTCTTTSILRKCWKLKKAEGLMKDIIERAPVLDGKENGRKG